MEHNLRCNHLQCRKELTDRAVVTTCSHIFCLECSNNLGLSNPPAGRRPVCPACDAQLNNPDDAVITNLRPTEDYKTSVLSGLDPGTIMECTSRALSFWAYQTTQEIVYDEMVTKVLTEKFQGLMAQTESITKDANDKIQKLHNKLSAMRRDVETLTAKNKELQMKQVDEHNKFLKLREQSDKMKSRSTLEHVQGAALDAVERTVQASAMGNRFLDCSETAEQQPYHQDYLNVATQRNHLEHLTHEPPVLGHSATMRPTLEQYNHEPNIIRGPQHMHSLVGVSHHRQPVTGTPAISRSVPRSHGQFTTPLPQPGQAQRTNIGRRPGSGPSPSSAPNHVGYQGYGLSGGMKTSYPQSHSVLGINESRNRPRVASRSGPGSVSSNLQHVVDANAIPMAIGNERYNN